MKTFKKLLGASVFLLSSFTASAGTISVGGVTWDPSSILDFEANSASFFQNTINNLGQELTGYGQVASINAGISFCNSCELTFEFGGFISSGVVPDPATIGANIFSSTGDSIEVDFTFTGGWVKFYVDNSQNYDPLDGTTAGDGTLWLSTLAQTMGSGSTLDADGVVVEWDGLAPVFDAIIDGTGLALLDVDGGLAMGNFDTNAKFGADFLMRSVFGSANPDNVTLQGESIPEPASIALFGLSLLGLAGAARRKQS